MVRIFSASAIALALLVGGGTVPAAGADPLADVPFTVADMPLFEAPWTGAGSRDHGTWSFDDGALVDGKVRLHLEITVAAPPMAIQSGPAVLFAGFSVYGDAGGDVGIGMNVAPVASKGIPACVDDNACTYSVDIAIPTDELPAAISRLRKSGKLIWVSADLTLVRTFGGGQWLQVLPFSRGEEGGAQAEVGRLGAMVPNHGDLYPAALFPAAQAAPIPRDDWDKVRALDYGRIVDAFRAKSEDGSAPIPMVDVNLHVRFEPLCPYEMELFLHDDLGNHLFQTWTHDLVPGIDETTSMPIGSPWFVTLDAGDGTLYPVVRLGPIISDGMPVQIDATLDCAGRTGRLALVGAATPTPIPTRRPLSSVGALAPTMVPTSGLSAASGPTAVPPSTNAGSDGSVALVVAALIGALGGVAMLFVRRRSVRS